MSAKPTNEETVEAVEETGALGTLGIDGGIFAAQLVNFLVVLLVLWKFAYKPIVKMLDQRSERIERSLKDAEHVEKRVAALEDERKALLAETRAETAKMMETARTEAEALKADLVEKAKREVERVVVNGKAQLKNDQEAMLRDARREMVEIAVSAARKILADGVDEKKAASLAEEVVRKLT
jgi:F-type H+-transporting ATPase subunit b